MFLCKSFFPSVSRVSREIHSLRVSTSRRGVAAQTGHRTPFARRPPIAVGRHRRRKPPGCVPFSRTAAQEENDRPTKRANERTNERRNEGKCIRVCVIVHSCAYFSFAAAAAAATARRSTRSVRATVWPFSGYVQCTLRHLFSRVSAI